MDRLRPENPIITFFIYMDWLFTFVPSTEVSVPGTETSARRIVQIYGNVVWLTISMYIEFRWLILGFLGNRKAF